LDPFGLKDDRAVGVADLAHRGAERNRGIGILPGHRKKTLDVHSSAPTPTAQALLPGWSWILDVDMAGKDFDLVSPKADHLLRDGNSRPALYVGPGAVR